MNIVLITEKPVIYSGEENVINITGTFIPYYDAVTKEFRYSGAIIEQIEKIKKQYDDLKVLIAYDFDENGEFLASILKKELSKIGIPEIDIFRTPLTEDNFILFTEFIDISNYMKYRKLDMEFIKEQKNKRIKNPLGLMKFIGLNFLLKNKEKKFKPNTGTSTFTVLYNFQKGKQ